MGLLNKINYIFNKVVNQIIFKNSRISISNYVINGLVYIKNEGNMKFGDNFKGNSGKKHNPINNGYKLRFITKKKGEIIIGSNVGISNSTLVSWSKITIHDNVKIGGGCSIWDTDFHSINPHVRKSVDNEIKTKEITICDNVWIGGEVIILKGTFIGENSIIASGSSVSGIIPENEIWGGRPARFIKKI